MIRHTMDLFAQINKIFTILMGLICLTVKICEFVQK